MCLAAIVVLVFGRFFVTVLVDHDRLLLGTEDALCVVELNKDSKL